jgi:hypothetical protein
MDLPPICGNLSQRALSLSQGGVCEAIADSGGNDESPVARYAVGGNDPRGRDFHDKSLVLKKGRIEDESGREWRRSGLWG